MNIKEDICNDEHILNFNMEGARIVTLGLADYCNWDSIMEH
jgi:hypothetical protein